MLGQVSARPGSGLGADAATSAGHGGGGASTGGATAGSGPSQAGASASQGATATIPGLPGSGAGPESGTGTQSGTGNQPAASTGPTASGGAVDIPGAAPAHASAPPSAQPSHPASPTAQPAHPASPEPAASSPAASPAKSAGRQYATPGTRDQQAFISLVAPGAMAAQQRFGVPAAVTIAQAIEESAWGASGLAAQYHNLFGIKGSGPAGSVSLPTSEFQGGQWVTIDAPFRAYHNDAESIADHAELLATSGYYTRAMADRAVPDAFANDLTGVYATDPDYGANLIALMKLYNLYQFGSGRAPATGPATGPTARRRGRRPGRTRSTAPKPGPSGRRCQTGTGCTAS